MKLQKTTLILLSASLLFLLGGPVIRAADTDIYLRAQTVSRDDSPNVLLILDNSGSMENNTVTTRPTYNPAVDYCTADLDTVLGIPGANAGKPSTCANIAGRIYFSYNGTPPGMSSTRWFQSSKNKCIDAGASFASSGFYGGTKIARWQSGGAWGGLRNRTNNDITYVDCEADGTTDGLSAGDGQFPRDNNSQAYTNNSRRAFNWANYTTDANPTLYSSNYMNYYHNSELVEVQTRMAIARSVVKSIIDANRNVRLGLMIFNRNDPSYTECRADGYSDFICSSYTASGGPHGGRLVYKIDNMTDARRTAMKQLVDDIVADTWTPLSETFWEAYLYLAGKPVKYGSADTSASPARDTSAELGTNYISPFAYNCQKAYIIYVTDGDPTHDTNANADIGSRIGVSNCEGSCMDDLAAWMNRNDIYDGLEGDQKVATYTISFGDGISADGLRLLEQTAVKGGGAYFNAQDADQLSSALQGALARIIERNTSFTAPSLSVNAFNRLYNRDEIYFALFKPSNSVAWEGNVKKYKLCTKSDMEANPPRCDELSDVLDQQPKVVLEENTAKIADNGWSYWTTSNSNPDGADVVKGGAGERVPEPALRTIYTYTGSYTGLTASTPASPVKIEIADSNAFYSAVKTDPTILGLPAGSAVEEVDRLFNWMLGTDTYDRNFNGASDDRRWAFGDPLHSRPVAVTYGAVTSGATVDYDNPIIKLFVGTNDGVVRMINNATGVEEWAFMPKEMHSVQAQLAQNAEGTHVHALDNTPSFWIRDVNRDGIIDRNAGDRVYMYISMRRGGRNIYAFDVTPTSIMTSQDHTLVPKLMWVIEGGSANFARLGETWSRPLVTRIRFKCTGSICDDGDSTTDDSESRVALIFAGGYDTAQDSKVSGIPDSLGNAIYIVDPLTGQRIWWASSDTGATLVLPQMKYSIPSDIALMDTDLDGSTDRIYVGDTGGQIWRLDLGDQIAVGSNGGTKGYVFADFSCAGGTRADNCSATAAQNHRKFFYPPDVAQVKDLNYSATAEYDLITIGSGDREDPLDLLTSNLTSGSIEPVHNRIYAIRDYNYQTGSPATIPAPLTESNMYDATEDRLRTLTGDALEAEKNILRASKGWFIDLKEATARRLPNGLSTVWAGEKVLARTSIFNGVIFATTFTPANDTNATTTCSANEGIAKQFVLNAFTAVGEGDFDKNPETLKTRSDQVGGGIPSEVVIVFRPDGTSGIIGTSGGAAAAIGDFTDPPKRTYWKED